MAYGPRGVVAVITPWNDPVAVSCGLLGAALVTGNTVVYKPSERTPATGWRLAQLLAPHFPEGVFSLLSGDGTVGAALAAGRRWTWSRTWAPRRPAGRSPRRCAPPAPRRCWRTAATTR